MNLDDLKEKKKFASTALLAVSLLAAILITVKVSGFLVAPSKAASALKGAFEQSEPDSKNLAAQLGKSEKVADALKKSNLFAPPGAKQNPVRTVMGIFGDEALINGKWYKAGDKVADAKVLAVNPTSVEIEWDGKKKTFSPIDGDGASSPSGPSRGRSTVSSRSSGSSSGKGSQMTVIKSRAGTKSIYPTKSGKGEKPPAKKMSQTQKNMSEAQREAFKRAVKAKRAKRANARR